MEPTNNKEVTILIPNYKTPEITKICMRLIRQHTDFNRVEVIVIDNNSGDASLDYLKSLKWITLIQRKGEASESAPLSHSRALDLALPQINTPYVLSIHTDTFVKNSDWLNVLLEPFKINPKLAGVGSWKLESKNFIQRIGYSIEKLWKFLFFGIFNSKRYKEEQLEFSIRYLRSHCAIYRTSIIKQLNTNFSDENQTAGKIMHKKMIDAGYEMLFLESSFLGRYVDHLNHATMVLNPELGSKKRSIRAGQVRIKKKLRGIDASAILANNALDL